MRKLASLTLSLFLLTGTAYADSPKDAPKDSPKDAATSTAKTAEAKPASKSNAEIAAEVEELRQALQAQQEQLQMLKEELAKRDHQIEEAREAAATANSRAAEANSKAAEAVTTSAEVKSTTTALNTTVASMAAGNAAAVNSAKVATSGDQKDEEKGPLAIRYKGITITPGGFFAAETVSRQRSLQSDVNSALTQDPYPGNALSKVSENNFSGRQSRLSLLGEGKVGDTKLTAYAEADFLSSGTNSNNRQSNSYVFRQRQIWGRVDFASGFAITGGQMWSLATENKKGIVNRGESLPVTIDAQYNAGFTWARQYGLRLTKTFNDKFAAAVSMEGSQTTIGGRGFTTLTNTSATGAVTTATNFFINAPGQSGGLLNAFDPTGYSVNKLPDFIVKAALDPGWGHYEVFGIVSEFRSRIYPCAVVGTDAGNSPAPATPNPVPCPVTAGTPSQFTSSALGATNQSVTGGGFGVSASAPLFHKKLDASIKGVYGTGIGRYGSAQVADLTARPDGTLSPIHDAMFLAKLELHPTPKVDIYGYLGGEYAARASYKGYTTIAITNTPALPPCGTDPTSGIVYAPCTAPAGDTPPAFQPGYPGIKNTKITTGAQGGYGNAAFNNSACNTETVPTNTGPAGSGFPTAGSCAGDIRYIGEGTLGFWHRIYQGEKGRVQWGIQYSYLYKVGWSGAGGGANLAPKAIDNMVFTSFRYYLP